MNDLDRLIFGEEPRGKIYTHVLADASPAICPMCDCEILEDDDHKMEITPESVTLTCPNGDDQ